MITSLFVAARILFVGAHPDDEILVAPWLGAMHRDGAHVGFLVATRGEQGPCYRPEGCEPDLATVREREMRDAAAVFGGEVAFGDCRDGSGGDPDDVLAAWARDAGGEEGLRSRFSRAIDAFAPTTLVTLDPRHGSTGHPDHRAVGTLVCALAPKAPILLAASHVAWGRDIHLSASDDRAEAFDARATWDVLLRNLACHRSQMRPSTIDAFARVPAEERKVWLLSAELALTTTEASPPAPR